MTDTESSMANFPLSLPRRVSLAVIAIAFVGLAIIRLRWIDAHAVNMLYWDQWDFYRSMFGEQSWWSSFTTQHGPHRQGVGMWFTRVLSNLSHWNNRWEGFAAFGFLFASALLSIPLAKRFGIASTSLALIALPFIFLNIHQYETWIASVNLSHGAVPVFLIVLLSLSFFIKNPWYKTAALSLLTFLLTFTGFGIFMGLVVPAIVVLEGIQELRVRGVAPALPSVVGVMLAGVTWALFSNGYHFDPAVPGFHFPYEKPMEYLYLMARMQGNFYGFNDLGGPQLKVGMVVLALLLTIVCVNLYHCLRRGVGESRKEAVLLALALYTLLYGAQCAIGRVFGGEAAGLAPRYATVIIPGSLAFFLQFGVWAKNRVGQGVLTLFVLAVIPATSWLCPLEVGGADWYANGKRKWKEAYLQTHDQAKANQISGWPVYPAEVTERLQYLEKHQLNLFIPEKKDK